jgi:hypothetical protein
MVLGQNVESMQVTCYPGLKTPGCIGTRMRGRTTASSLRMTLKWALSSASVELYKPHLLRRFSAIRHPVPRRSIFNFAGQSQSCGLHRVAGQQPP